ncbi:Outer membrane receptor proteins, mostly Fe transport [Sphingobium sp. AP50]|uniref:TonB-dependent receptor n=1 Tax=Sphingobium sp. AP50 TaxID=1884369 RepID=UPI0008B7860D|nr:TonB-dependent receptor [Sphingobium sp. AP50]SEJ73860.1 Outer membrane receptor proteins, mostly Fe transport [Sphingobium sp. AP50]
MTISRRTVQCSIFALAIGMAQAAHAQTPQAAGSDTSANTGAEIVVTAQKRAERLLDVPVAISAIGGEALAKQNLNRISDYFDRVPGLQFSGQRISALSLRGVTTGGGTGPTLAILVDDVQFGSSTGGGQSPIPDFDSSTLERIEVLRGPQGTLYGASSLGGIIKYVLKEPRLDKVSGRVEVGGTHMSDGDQGWVTRGSINLPLTDWLAVNASGFYRDDAAWLDNANPAAAKSKDTNSRKVWGFRGAALIQPIDNLKFVLSGLYQKQEAVNSDLAVTSGGVPLRRNSSGAISYQPAYGDLTLYALDSLNKSKYQMYTARGELDLGGAQLNSITAWSRSDNILSNDVTSVFRPLFSLPISYGSSFANGSVSIGNADYTHKFSQELRLSGQTTLFDWLAGGFYTIEHSGVNQSLYLYDGSGTLADTPYIAAGPSSYREYAGFADLTFHLAEGFDLQFGGRYARNKQTSASNVTTTSKAAPLFGPTRTQMVGSKDSAFTWLVSPSYHISKDMMVYARVATGYRPGGPNLESAVTASFDPDRVTNYEVGFKGNIVPGLLTVDTALFQIDWKKVQLQGTAASQLSFVTNGDTARSRGWEFATTLTPWTGMTVAGNFALTDAKLTADLPNLGTGGLVGRDGDKLPFTADFTSSISVDQRLPVNDSVEASFGATLTHVGERPGALTTTLATRPRLDIPAYTSFDLRAGLEMDQLWSLSFYVRNFFNERGVTLANDRNGTSVPTALYILPRSFGLTLARDF